MPNLVITTSTFDLGDPSAPFGSAPWAKSVHLDAMHTLNDAKASAESLQLQVKALRDSGGYRHLTDSRGQPFLLWEAYCVERQPLGLGYSPEAIDAIISERRTVEARAAQPKILDEPHRPSRGSRTNNPDNVRVTEYGNDPDYLTARIARDHPDVLQRMRDGEFRSVRAAAIEAGIVRPSITIAPTVDGFYRAIIKHLSADDRAALGARLVAE